MSAQLAVLGLLMEQPNHGYGIERLIEERGMRNWTPIGFSSIYYVLDQLVADGLAQSHAEPAPGRGKERKVHVITPKGRRVWHHKTALALTEVRHTADEFLLAMSCLPLLSRDEVRTALEQRTADLTSRIDDLARNVAALRPVPEHVEAMFDFTAARLRQEHDWITSFVANTPSEPEEVQR